MSALLALLLLASMAAGLLFQATAQAQAPAPLLAYYYIWFDEPSWDRAKSDYPLLGRYSSDDREVMRQHAKWAREAGITGFIVSWKSTEKLNRRLERVADIAREEGLALLLIYQGLDFDRQPLETARIARDLAWFAEKYVDEEPFLLFDRPVVIWSGTWEFTPEQIARVTQGLRDRLWILASERSLEGYRRLAEAVDGNAYYWSSVDPENSGGYADKLSEMGQAVHSRGGLWIAPAAPGYDSRPLGGTRVVPRREGDTLRMEMAAARASQPDAIGLISWNEFSENTHIEPSVGFGLQYLEVLAALEDEALPVPIGFGSDQPVRAGQAAPGSGFLALFVLALVMVTSLVTIAVRRTRAVSGHAGPSPGQRRV